MVEKYLDDLGDDQVKILGCIETAKGFVRLREICEASKRLDCLIASISQKTRLTSSLAQKITVEMLELRERPKRLNSCLLARNW